MKALLLDLEVYKFKNDKNELAIQLNEWINSYFIEFKASCDDKLNVNNVFTPSTPFIHMEKFNFPLPGFIHGQES